MLLAGGGQAARGCERVGGWVVHFRRLHSNACPRCSSNHQHLAVGQKGGGVVVPSKEHVLAREEGAGGRVENLGRHQAVVRVCVDRLPTGDEHLQTVHSRQKTDARLLGNLNTTEVVLEAVPAGYFKLEHQLKSTTASLDLSMLCFAFKLLRFHRISK